MKIITKTNKLISFGIRMLVPNFIKNLYLMIKYRCIIHPKAKILFIRNLKIGKNTIIGRCDIVAQGLIQIGQNCLINDYVILNSKTGHIKIGDSTAINSFSVIYGNGGVEIGKYNAIAHSVKIIKNHNIPTKKNVGYSVTSEEPTKIGDYVWLCANVVIVDGVIIGDNTVIGANSFVSKSIPSSVIAAGCPAKVLRERIYE